MWNALYSAALSTVYVGAVIPVFHWLFTSVPALLVAWLTTRRGNEDQVAAALATGVVTLPLFTLGWALLYADGRREQVVSTLRTTAVLGVTPFVVAVVTFVRQPLPPPPFPQNRPG